MLRDPGFPRLRDNADRMLDAKIKKEWVSDVYGRIAPLYDIWAWLTERKARDRCLDLAAIRDGEDVLEVAVGTGLAFARILESNPSGHNEGIDLTPAMLVRAEKRASRTGLGRYNLQVGDAYDLPFPDDSFDVVVNCYMFDLLPGGDFVTVLDEFNRVLRPGGRLAIVNMTEGKHWYNGLWHRLYRMNPALLGGCRPVSLFSLLQEVGFRDATKEYVSQFTFPSEVIFGTKP